MSQENAEIVRRFSEASERAMKASSAAILLLAMSLAVLAAPALAKKGGAVVRVSADPYSDPAGQHATEVEPDSAPATPRW